MRGLFGSMLAVQAASGSETLTLTDPADRWFGVDVGAMSNSGRRVSPDLALRLSAVYACVNLLSKTVASLPLRMYRIERGTTGSGTSKSYEAPEHPLNDLLEHQPNRWQTAWDFRAMLQMHLSLRGNAYAEIISGPRGFADRLEPIHPDRMNKVERLPDGTLRYTFTDENNQRVVRLQDEMLHLRSAIAPGLVGISPVSYARETIGLGLATEEHGARLFSNGARPSGVVQMSKRMSDPAFERFKAQWRQMYNGLHNAGSTPILEEGAEFKSIALTSEDAQFLGTREFQIEEIARWFDVPLVMLHHMTKTSSWGTGVEAIMLAFVRNNLMPWLSSWTSAIRRDLIIAPNYYEARFDVEELQRGDSKAQAEFFNKLVIAGILTRNEARAALGYNPLGGLDEPLVPNSNAKPADNASDPPPGSALMGHNGGPPLSEAPSEMEQEP